MKSNTEIIEEMENMFIGFQAKTKALHNEIDVLLENNSPMDKALTKMDELKIQQSNNELLVELISKFK